MSLLTQTQWNEIIRASAYMPQDGLRCAGRYIGLDALRKILEKPKRTSEQNALLWQLYTDIIALGGEALGGWTKDDIHEYMLGEYFGWDKCEAFGRVRLKPKKRSSRLTKSEFSDFLEFICQRMAEHGIYLTLPGETEAA